MLPVTDTDSSHPTAGASESDLDIDWAKEPVTDRERRIRAVLLREAIADRPAFVRLNLGALLSESATRCSRSEDAASDFREAYATAQAIFDEGVAKRKKRRIEAAIREVDGGDDLAR